LKQHAAAALCKKEANVPWPHPRKSFAENSPAIHGWENRNTSFQVPAGTKEMFARPRISFVAVGNGDAAKS